MIGFGREETAHLANKGKGPSKLLDIRWKRIILGTSLQRQVANPR
jgi:hypothetical protein